MRVSRVNAAKTVLLAGLWLVVSGCNSAPTSDANYLSGYSDSGDAQPRSGSAGGILSFTGHLFYDE